MPEPRDWFDRPDPTGVTRTGEVGLRFSCTQCGNCCSGLPGFIGFTPEEGRAIARTLGVSEDEFLQRYTRDTPEGRSIKDIRPEGSASWDCVFLARENGRTGCSIYEARPAQCRTWPFWRSNLRSRDDWDRASESCPGMNTGELQSPEVIRVTRDRVDI